jgi:hypothetical protein
MYDISGYYNAWQISRPQGIAWHFNGYDDSPDIFIIQGMAVEHLLMWLLQLG